jgi:uncharacterized protein YqhQ
LWNSLSFNIDYSIHFVFRPTWAASLFYEINQPIVLLPVLAVLPTSSFDGQQKPASCNVQWLMKPNLALQHLTTAEPDTRWLKSHCSIQRNAEQEEMIHDEDSVKVIPKPRF